MKEYFLYQHLKESDNTVFYIGIGNKRRPYTKHGRNKLWERTVNKYGYKVEIITTVNSWESICECEMYLIGYHGRRDLKRGELVNMTDGGEGLNGWKPTPEQNKANSERNKGKKGTRLGCAVSKETKKKISEAAKGRRPSNKTKRRMRKAHAGKKYALGSKRTLEQKKSQSERMKGHKHSNETKLKISKANQESNIGYKHTKEARKNMGKAQKGLGCKPVLINGVRYSGVAIAMKKLKCGLAKVRTLNELNEKPPTK